MAKILKKKCYKCKIKKPPTAFWKHKKHADGLQHICIDCSKNWTQKLICTNCNKTFKIKHRNISKRKTSLCTPCVIDYSTKKLIERNKARTKDLIYSTKGYEYVRDFKTKHGYIFGHRKIMEEHLKRPLTKKEVVHHIDGDPLNNEIKNLFLTDNSLHRKAHQSLQEVALFLYRKGDVIFNKKTGRYELRVSISGDAPPC